MLCAAVCQVGLSEFTKREHVVRAALESAAFQSLELIQAMETDCGQRVTGLRVDGGMAVNPFVLQFQADLLQQPVSDAC